MPRPMLTTRVDPAVVARVERCAEAMNGRAEPGALQMERGAVVRLLILRALPGLEAELAIVPARGAKRAAVAKGKAAPNGRGTSKLAPKRTGTRRAAALDPTPPDPHRRGAP